MTTLKKPLTSSVGKKIKMALTGEELPLHEMMIDKFQNTLEVVIYLLSFFTLIYNLLHGFKSTFQSLGLSHRK